MRRSAAPSMKKDVFKRGSVIQAHDDKDSTNEIQKSSNPLCGKRVFRVVWRNITTKKHKTWNGDGTLEATVGQALLKDDTGKYMGSVNNLKTVDLEPDLQITIGDKEVELLDEIKTAEEYLAHQRQEMANRACGSVDYAREEGETKKPKGTFIFRSLLHLDKPQVALVSSKQLKPNNELFKLKSCNENSVPERTERLNSRKFNQPQQRASSVGANSKSETIFWGTKKRRVSMELLEPASDLSYKPDNEVYKQLANKVEENNHSRSAHSITDLICFLQPSELQYVILSKCYELCAQTSKIVFQEHTPAAVLDICQRICDHPTLLQQDDSQASYLINQFAKELPDWSEMGPFDSAKFEFAQSLINRFALDNREKCIFIVNDPEAIVILRGYCDYAQINSLTIDENTCSTNYARLIKRFNVPANDDADPSLLAFIQSSTNLDGFQLCDVKRIIFYNYAPNLSLAERIKAQDNVCVYHLITAGCFEEHKFLRQIKEPSFNNHEITESVVTNFVRVELNSSACLTHEVLDCKCEAVECLNKEMYNKSSVAVKSKLTSWAHCEPPFDATFSKMSNLSDDEPNLKFVFYKTFFFD